MDIVWIVLAAVAGFVGGVLVGRRNRNTVDKVVDKVEKRF